MPSRFKLLRRLLTLCAITLLVMQAFTDLWSHLAIDPPASVLSLPWAAVAFGAMLVSSFWLYTAIPAELGVVVSIAFRMHRTSVVLILCASYAAGPWAWSLVRPVTPVQPGSLSVFSANVLYSRADLSRLDAEITRVDPDVLVFQEVDALKVRRLRAVLGDRYPYWIAEPSQDAFGQATFSRLPFVDEPVTMPEAIVEANGEVAHIITRVLVDDLVVEIHNTHTFPPLGRRFMVHQHRHARALTAHKSDADAVVLAGDLNSPDRGSILRLLNRDGFISVHAARGRGPVGLLVGRRGEDDVQRVLAQRSLRRGLGGSVFGSGKRRLGACCSARMTSPMPPAPSRSRTE